MAKYSKSPQTRSPQHKCPTGPGTVFRDTKPETKSPLKEQFEPTESLAVRQHAKMAGVA